MPETVTKEPIAVIGYGCVLPDAPDVPTFWDNLLQGKNSIREVPAERWDTSIYWSQDKSIPDMTYAKIGAFVLDDAFNGLEYRMPPKMQAQIDPCQRWALSATRQAFQDAGYETGLRGDQGKAFDRDRCAVIIGNAMGGELQKHQHKRIVWAEAKAALEADPDFAALPEATRSNILSRVEAQYKQGTNEVTEDTMPGHLSNVIAGRIANAFDLGGKNFTTDAACASSLAALDAAMDSLRDGESDMVVWGGTDRSMDVSAYVQFSKIGALSPDGSRPFDKGANGFVMGEGCAMFILKRLRDAERDGDTIHAVVRGIGGSSDGKGKGITAPNPAGQVKAVQRAYADAECELASVGYLEAHGTSTPVGDPVELESVINAAKDSPTPPATGSIYVGSVKSNIGHLKAGAGAAGALKAVLAVQHGIIPPSINVKELNPRIDWGNSPFRVATERIDWQSEGPRRAAISSFGFGGTNFHVVLEQYVPGHLQVVPAGTAAPVAHATPAAPAATATGSDNMTEQFDVAAFRKHMEGAAHLEAQSLVLDADALPGSIMGLPQTVAFAETGDKPRYRDLFRPLTADGVKAERRVGLAVTDISEIPKKLELAQKAAANPAVAKLAFQQGVFINQGQPKGKVAFLFPGQGTQYVNMGRDLAKKYAIVRNTFAEADDILFDELGGIKLTDILWPTPNTPENQKASNEKLKLTEFTQPAVLTMDVAILRLLKQWGVEPDVVAGHSLGEYGALVAAGVMGLGDALHAVAARGREMANVELPDLGKMASIPADWETVSKALEQVDEYVICANKNCPSQTVIAGSSAGVEKAVELLTAQGLQCMFLPVSAAFHSEIVAPASKPLRNVLARLNIQSPKVTCLSNVGAVPYQDDPEWIRDNLATQVASPVEWIGIIERMRDEGVTTFIEVGPKKALTGFCMDILKDTIGKQQVAVCSNHPKKGEIQHINELFAFLGAWGYQPQLPNLDDTAMYTPEFRDPTAAFRQTAPAQSADLSATLARIEARLSALESGAEPGSGVPAKATIEPPLTAQAVMPIDPAVAAPGPAGAIAVSGISVGLPGQNKPFFAPDNWDRILRGDNLIDALSADDRAAMVEKSINRLVKSAGGQGTFETIDDPGQVIKLAGRRGSFDLGEWGISQELTEVLDVTSQYAIAAGLEALRDAGIPLQRTYKTTSTGSQLPQGWALPKDIGDETGIIFASAFPGIDAWLENLKAGAKHEAFNRKFLFHVLSMGHAQVAQFLGARGPNTQVNAACASTTQAIAIAEDWIKAGRCKRVLVLGADDATSPNLMEWIGSGFLASGAATTEEDVTKAALPFDARRHGMIIGMGAVGLVVEAETETNARGMRPIARLLASEIANSAFHGSRLDVEHIAGIMQNLVAKTGLRPSDIAAHTVFMSHETYTPARGGSAAAEIHALRAAFGADANKVVIANTKGFTGHPQGAGIEDAVVLKALQRGTVPPIPNLQQPDPELGDLNLSKGGHYDVRFALRLAAGFGSQVAMTLTELVAKETERVADQARYDAWLASVTGISGAKTEVVDRTLRVIDSGPSKPAAPAAVATPPAPVATPAPAPALTVAGTDPAEALAKVTALVAQKTGYPDDMLDPDMDMEADLGIDTVKQAELFGEMREIFGVPLDESLQLKDYNTLRKVAHYMATGAQAGSSAATAPTAAPAASTPAAPADTSLHTTVAEAHAPNTSGNAEEALEKVTALVAEKTGYPTDMLDPDMDMEADLGIDTVKQAELFGELREHFGVPLDESLQLADYNTLRKVAGYMAGGSEPSSPAAATNPATGATQSSVTDDEALAKAHSEASSPPSGHATPEQALTQVTALVAEKTGYPAEMLEADLDMEADLGIDTVKQAELFGEMREIFGVPLDESLQLADYNTLRKVAVYMAGGSAPSGPAAATAPASAATSSAAPAPSPPTAAAPATASASREDALAKVTEVIAAKTGYPAEMLEPDLDMEADLGIDTVKQAELFGELRAHFGVPLDESLQLADYNTLRKVAAYMSTGAPAPGAQHDASGTPSTATATPETTSATAERPPAATATEAAQQHVIVRRIPVPRAEDSPGVENPVTKGALLVIGDTDKDVTSAFEAAGFAPSPRAQDPVGILCIATRPGDSGSDRAGQLFDTAKALRSQLGKGTSITIVTAQDGAHGLRKVRDAAMAAVAGAGKALRKEFPDATVKVIDLHPDAEAALAATELLSGGTRCEVAFDKSGQRYVIDVAPEELEDAMPDVAGKTIVVSGGAQGITVEMLAALAPQQPKFLLLGRTAMPAEAEQWATWDEARWKQEEQAVMQRMKDAGEKVTPVALKKALAPMKKAAEVSRNLQRLSDLGAEVGYAPVDVTNADGVAKAVGQAREAFGPIAGVIHAAGVEISKDIASKDRAQFDLVFGIKHDGLNALLDATAGDDLEFLASFGSVAGRFGNIGQVDYSAVNEYLCKAIKQTAAERNIPTAFTIAWGPWGEVGMATQGSIMQIMEASGVTPIPTQDGVMQFLREMGTPGIRECVVAGTLGAIDADGQVVATFPDVTEPSPEIEAMEAAPERFRLIDGVEVIDDHHVTTRIVMDQASMPYAKDHAIDGVPYLPGVFGLESFAESCSLLAPQGTVCTRIEGARFGIPVKQLKQRPVTARIEADKVSDDGDEETIFDCRLTTRMVGPDGVERGEPRTHFEARLVFAVAPETETIDGVPPCTRELGKDEIYPPFFHGPSFQVLRYAGPLEAEESVGAGAMPYAAAFTEGEAVYAAQPLLVEALFQLCGLRTMAIDEKMSLPAAIDQLDILQHQAPSGEVRLWCRYEGESDGLRRFDAAATTTDGTIILRMSGYGMVETGPAPTLKHAQAAPDETSDDASAAGATEANGKNGATKRQTVQVDLTTTDQATSAASAADGRPEDAGPNDDSAPARTNSTEGGKPAQTTLSGDAPDPFADLDLPSLDGVVLAAANVSADNAESDWFTDGERDTAAGFPVDKRRQEWCAGRLAAKAAVMQAAEDLQPTDITVINEDGGRPVIHVKGEAIPAVLSITHRDGLALAAVAEGPLGIDLETTEARSNGFHEEAFNAKERPFAEDPVGAACLWAAKEAVFKRIGTGLKQSLHAWTVQPDEGGSAVCSGPEGTFQVRFFDVAGRILAVSGEALDTVETTH